MMRAAVHGMSVVLVLVCTGCLTVPPEAPPAVPPVAAVEPSVPVFEDITEAAGLGGFNASYVKWFDADNDGDADLLVNGRTLFRNAGLGQFRLVDVSEAAGLGGAKAGPVVCVDMDNDGWTDIVSTRGHIGRNRGGGTFVDVASEWGFMPHEKSNVLGAGDINGDGFVDVYIAMKEDWNKGHPKYYPHQLWLGNRGQALSEIGEAAGIARSTYGRSVLFGDVNEDGRPDIFVGNYRLQANLLWLNLGDNRFKEAAGRFGVRGRKDPERYYDEVARRHYGPRYGHTIGACWLDFDNDGKMDLFTANLVHKYVGPSSLKSMRYDIRGYVCDDSAIYRRTASGFADWRDPLSVPRHPIGGAGIYKGDELWSGCAAGDVNNDGWMDVFVPQIYNLPYARGKMLLNWGGTAFRDVAGEAGIARIDTYAGAFADVDGDGLLDLVTAGRAGKDKPRGICLYRNGGSGEGSRSWIKVALRSGPERGTFVGALVSVQNGAELLTQLAGAGSSTYGQQNDPLLHFGLGAQPPAIITVSVKWPWGETDTRKGTPGAILVFEAP